MELTPMLLEHYSLSLKAMIKAGTPSRTRARSILGLTTEVVITCVVLSTSTLQLATRADSISPRGRLGNVTLGDLVIILLGGLLCFSTQGRAVAHLLFVRMRYLLLALGGTVALLLPVIFADDQTYQLKQAGQFLFVVWIFVPVIAVGLACSSNYFEMVRRLSWQFVIIYIIGLALYYMIGDQSIIRVYGENRLFSAILFDGLAFCSMACVVTIWMAPGSFRNVGSALVMSAVVLVWVVLAASRTGFVMLCAAVASGLIGRGNWSVRWLLGIAVGAATLYLAYQWLFVRSSDFVMLRKEGLEDAERIALIKNGFALMKGKEQSFWFGLGWDVSGIHNFVLQSFVDSGIFAAIFFLLYGLAPLLWGFRLRHSGVLELNWSRTLTLIFLTQLGLNAIPTLRAYWVAMAAAIGALLWVSLQPRSVKPSIR